VSRCQAIGEGATTSSDLGQASIARREPRILHREIFNFPTMTELARIACFDVPESSVGAARRHLKLAHPQLSLMQR